jgi:hypothetical protein
LLRPRALVHQLLLQAFALLPLGSTAIQAGKLQGPMQLLGLLNPGGTAPQTKAQGLPGKWRQPPMLPSLLQLLAFGVELAQVMSLAIHKNY